MARTPRTPDSLRQHVVTLLDGGRAHARATDVLRGFPADRCGERPRGMAHSGWQLVEHLRIAQRDMLDWCRTPGHESPPWPEGYWPKAPKPPDSEAWDRSVRAFLADLRTSVRIARDPRIDLLAPLPHVGVCWLHELILIADHAAWHLGQLLLLQRCLEAKPRR